MPDWASASATAFLLFRISLPKFTKLALGTAYKLVHSVVGSGILACLSHSPTIGNLYPFYPRFSGLSLDKVAADGENDPISAERGPKTFPPCANPANVPAAGSYPFQLLSLLLISFLCRKTGVQHSIIRCKPVRRRYSHSFVGIMRGSTSCRCFLLGLWAYDLQYK